MPVRLFKGVVSFFKGAVAVVKGALAVVRFQLRVAVKFAKVAAQAGSVNLKALMTTIIIAFIALIFIVQFTPTIETNVSSANITNTFTSSMVDMAVWILPVGAVVGVIFGIIKLFGGGRSKGGG